MSKKDQPAVDADRQMPHDLHAEKGVVGGIYLMPELLEDIAHLVSPHEFFDQVNATAFKHVSAAIREGERPDQVSILPRITAAGDAHLCDWLPYFYEVGRFVPHLSNTAHYAMIVRAQAQRRNVILKASELMREAYAGADPLALCETMERGASEIADTSTATKVIEASTAIDQAISRIRERRQQKTIAIRTGLHRLDGMCGGGLHPGELIIIAARPGVGKTSLMMQITENASTDRHRVLVATIEMEASDLMERMIVGRSDVDPMHVRRGKINDLEMQVISEAGESSRDLPISLLDNSRMKVSTIRQEARRMKRQGLALVCVDYLGLLEAGDSKGKRYEQVGEITRDLKRMARELKIPIVLLAQLNREADKQGKATKPKLSHLRESGSIEQDSDVVILLHEDDTNPDMQGKVEVIVAKNRRGPTGPFTVRFNKAATRFVPHFERHPGLSEEVPAGQGFD